MSGPLEIVIGGSPDEPQLVVRGEIDLSTVGTLRTAVGELPRQPPERLRLDLSGVGFMDSTGLGWLAQLARDGCDLVLEGTPPTVRKVLEISGVDGLVTLTERPQP